jgi:hypothetical protein
VFQDPSEAVRSEWLGRADAAGSDVIQMSVAWRGVAPAVRPAGFNPSDPGDPAYQWGQLDAAVAGATQRGLRVVLRVTGAPSWAEGPNRAPSAPAGSWKPKPGSLRDFARAIARRYSGNFGSLPRVRFFQLWAEPNLSIYLTPQWRSGRAVAPRQYRRMLRAFYAGIKSVSRRNKVIGGGTAPYGDPGRRGDRMQPLKFWRTLLCLKGPELDEARCRKPAKLDIVAHHPINVGRPRRRARNRDDVSTPDLGKIKRVVRKARRTGRLKPRGRKPLWATEIWWDSRPPDPGGVRELRHARYLAEAFFVLWKQGVSTAVWFHIRDPESSEPAFTQESGLYFRDGDPKLALQAFRFPFAAEKPRGRRARVWGRAPTTGQVRIETRRSGGWRTVARVRARRGRVFVRRVRGKRLFRAVAADGLTSVSFKAHRQR